MRQQQKADGERRGSQTVIEPLTSSKQVFVKKGHYQQGIDDNEDRREPSWPPSYPGKHQGNEGRDHVTADHLSMHEQAIAVVASHKVKHEHGEDQHPQPRGPYFAAPPEFLQRKAGFIYS